MRLASIAFVSSLTLVSSLFSVACSGDDHEGTTVPPEAEGGSADAHDDAAPLDASIHVSDSGDGGTDGTTDAARDATLDARDAGESIDASDANESIDASDANESIDASESVDASDAAAEATTSDSGADADAEGGIVSTSCMDLSGKYQENADVLTLTRPDCGSLTWARAPAFDGSPGYTHVYMTDGLARAVTDEMGNSIVETATVDDVAMHVHRTSATGLDEHQTVRWTNAPCNLLNPQGVYMARETTNAAGQQTKCEFWSYDDNCSGTMRTCIASPANKCQTDIVTDTNNCGTCGVVCGTNNTTKVQCWNDLCKLTCAQGFANCSGALADGCETDITTVSNCGACNKVCGAAGTASSKCTNGACAIVCDATHANCDGLASNGCEVDITSSSLACGGCGTDCGGALCNGSKCVSQGKTLVTGLSQSVDIQVDATTLYYRDNTTLYALDKVNGGTPVAIATNVGAWIPAGDGSVYFASQSSTPTTIARWAGAGAGAQPVATLTGLLCGLFADSTGLVWCDEYPSGDAGWGGNRDSAVHTRSPSDAAPHDLYVSLNQYGGMTVVALTANDVVALVPGAGTILRISRASGAAQTIDQEVGYLEYERAMVVGSTVYLTDSIRHLWTVPLTGGTPTIWWTEPNDFFVATDGASIVVNDPARAYANIEQLPLTSAAPTPIPLAYGSPRLSSFYPPMGPWFAIDATTIYLWDATKQQIRAVAR